MNRMLTGLCALALSVGVLTACSESPTGPASERPGGSPSASPPSPGSPSTSPGTTTTPPSGSSSPSGSPSTPSGGGTK